jgi:hypothetical protein
MTSASLQWAVYPASAAFAGATAGTVLRDSNLSGDLPVPLLGPLPFGGPGTTEPHIFGRNESLPVSQQLHHRYASRAQYSLAAHPDPATSHIIALEMEQLAKNPTRVNGAAVKAGETRSLLRVGPMTVAGGAPVLHVAAGDTLAPADPVARALRGALSHGFAADGNTHVVVAGVISYPSEFAAALPTTVVAVLATQAAISVTSSHAPSSTAAPAAGLAPTLLLPPTQHDGVTMEGRTGSAEDGAAHPLLPTVVLSLSPPPLVSQPPIGVQSQAEREEAAARSRLDDFAARYLSKGDAAGSEGSGHFDAPAPPAPAGPTIAQAKPLDLLDAAEAQSLSAAGPAVPAPANASNGKGPLAFATIHALVANDDSEDDAAVLLPPLQKRRGPVESRPQVALPGAFAAETGHLLRGQESLAAIAGAEPSKVDLSLGDAGKSTSSVVDPKGDIPLAQRSFGLSADASAPRAAEDAADEWGSAFGASKFAPTRAAAPAPSKPRAPAPVASTVAVPVAAAPSSAPPVAAATSSSAKARSPAEALPARVVTPPEAAHGAGLKIEWQWKRHANAPDSDPRAWLAYSPAVGAALERAFMDPKTATCKLPAATPGAEPEYAVVFYDADAGTAQYRLDNPNRWRGVRRLVNGKLDDHRDPTMPRPAVPRRRVYIVDPDSDPAKEWHGIELHPRRATKAGARRGRDDSDSGDDEYELDSFLVSDSDDSDSDTSLTTESSESSTSDSLEDLQESSDSESDSDDRRKKRRNKKKKGEGKAKTKRERAKKRAGAEDEPRQRKASPAARTGRIAPPPAPVAATTTNTADGAAGVAAHASADVPSIPATVAEWEML